MKRNLTCIVCPLGCEIEAELDNGRVISVAGNSCKRGAEYAKNECTNPQRTVTSTVKCKNGALVPVKTDRTIPKSRVAECMAIINAASPDLPISIGDVIIENVFGSNIVATANMK